MTAVWTSIGAIPCEVFLHKQFGRRYIGAEAFIAIFQIMLFALMFSFYAENTPYRGHPRLNPAPLVLFCGLYIFMLLLARSAMRRRERRGEIEHSRYNGWPILLSPRLGKYERFFKIVIEPGAVLFLAMSLLHVNFPLAFYLMFNAGCMFWSNIVNVRFERHRAMDMRDKMMEQRATAGLLRNHVHRW
jgi:hypothetical protein